jgi:uncharacterized protein involved in exopolysaccharide biosynthesis
VKKVLTIDDLSQQLQQLRSRYSDLHPDVIRLKAAIAQMEEEESTDTSKADYKERRSIVPPGQTVKLMRLQRNDLLVEMKLIDAEILQLRQEKEKTTAEIKEYQRRIESGPKIEQMFVDLRRDYVRANENYQSLLQKKLEAELAENLEHTQKGEQFKIIDHANLPKQPFKPDIPRILAMGFLLAISCGIGLAFVREYLDPTFYSVKELENTLELPVLVSIPVIPADRDSWLNWSRKAASVCTLVVMASILLYALFVLWRENPNLLPL